MRTLTDATMFVVNGPRGPYYALQDNDTGVVVTESTEQAAATLANEKDMLIVDRREISHAELQKMLGKRAAEHAGGLRASRADPAVHRAHCSIVQPLTPTVS